MLRKATSLKVAFLSVVAGMATMAGSASAQTSFTNGTFETYTVNPARITAGQAPSANFMFTSPTGGLTGGYGGDITGWGTAKSPTTGGNTPYMTLFDYNNATTSAAVDPYGNSKLPNTFPGVSPDGSQAFVVLEGDPGYNSYLYQQITGLTIGASYDLSFWWAATMLAPDVPASGPYTATSEKLAVSFTTTAPGSGMDVSGRPTGASTVGGNSYFVTNTINYTNNGSFNGSGNNAVNGGWLKVTTKFVASATTQWLSFLSLGTPSGLPPVALLDGVTFASTPVPEPGSMMLLLGGVGTVVAVARRRRA